MILQPDDPEEHDGDPTPIVEKESVGGAALDTKGMPESKPEKSCGNCALGLPDDLCEGICLRKDKSDCNERNGYIHWQPKAAEPQGWEQRFDFKFVSPCIGCTVQTESNNSCDDCPDSEFDVLEKDIAEEIKSFIRAEIEREVEKEKNRFLKYLKKAIGIWPSDCDVVLNAMILDIEQNKHREGRK